MLRTSFLIFVSLLFSASLCTGQQTKTKTVSNFDPSSVSIENLFAQADLVAFVRVLSGDNEHYEGAVYKAVVLKAYKESKASDIVYFTPFISYGVGSEYLVFLKKTDKRIGDIVGNASKTQKLPYDPALGFYRIMYDGYSIMPVSFECVFEEPAHQTCGYAVKFNTKQVTLPSRLKIFPEGGVEVDGSNNVKYLKKGIIESLLESLARQVRVTSLGVNSRSHTLKPANT